MVDGISSQAPSFTPPSVPLPSAVPPTLPAPGQQPAPGFPSAAVPGQQPLPGFLVQPVLGVSNAAAPTFVPDFSSGSAGTYVLDWRDPSTKQVLVQVPMRTALASFAGADKTDAPVGKQLNTAV